MFSVVTFQNLQSRTFPLGDYQIVEYSITAADPEGRSPHYGILCVKHKQTMLVSELALAAAKFVEILLMHTARECPDCIKETQERGTE
jgi:hypothetical protein